MPLMGISNRGLLLITFLVALLWGCILAEHAIVSGARQATDLIRVKTYPASWESKDQPRIRLIPGQHPGRNGGASVRTDWPHHTAS